MVLKYTKNLKKCTQISVMNKVNVRNKPYLTYNGIQLLRVLINLFNKFNKSYMGAFTSDFRKHILL